MAKKNNDWKERLGVVFSTESDYDYDYENDKAQKTLPPEEQTLTVSTDKRHRKGKSVILIEGFIGTEDDLKNLEKMLKTKCGAGGSAKNGAIIIQGEFKDKIAELLKKSGYRVKKKG